jgi:hypothetical protein
MPRAFRLLLSIVLLLTSAGCLATSLWAESAVLAALGFLLLYPWAPVRTQAAASAGRAGTAKHVLLVLGAIVALAGPMLFMVLGGLSAQLPGCVIGGSGGPAYGCRLAGFDIDGLIGLVTPAFVISFITVPAGLLLVLLGALWPRRKPDPGA